MISSYPDDSYHNLKDSVARKFGCKNENVCVGNGSIEIIRTFFYATVSRGDQVRTDPHTFGEYSLSARLAGAECTYQSNKNVKVHVICNPNNPTGKLLSFQELSELAKKEDASGSRLFIDEAFNELSDGAETLIGKGFSNVFVSRSLTKCFSVPGLRIGFGFGDPKLIEKMEVIRPPWTLNGFAESFALLALENYDKLEKSRQLIRTEREWLCNKFKEIGIDYIPSPTNFILLNIGQDSGKFTQDMLKQGIFVRDCSSFGLKESIRVAVRTRDENEYLVEALIRCCH
ncbi:MAG: histidinol-phosphate aminotransferase family protein [Methanomicrobiaceae archaeon]|nr:histidinol-phosphate aminotransferase family protein [Methanomicrobiaceae archaeon]